MFSCIEYFGLVSRFIPRYSHPRLVYFPGDSNPHTEFYDLDPPTEFSNNPQMAQIIMHVHDAHFGKNINITPKMIFMLARLFLIFEHP